MIVQVSILSRNNLGQLTQQCYHLIFQNEVQHWYSWTKGLRFIKISIQIYLNFFEKAFVTLIRCALAERYDGDKVFQFQNLTNGVIQHLKTADRIFNGFDFWSPDSPDQLKVFSPYDDRFNSYTLAASRKWTWQFYCVFTLFDRFFIQVIQFVSLLLCNIRTKVQRWTIRPKSDGGMFGRMIASVGMRLKNYSHYSVCNYLCVLSQ